MQYRKFTRSSVWSGVVCCWFAVVLLAGGISTPNRFVALGLIVSASLILAISLLAALTTDLRGARLAGLCVVLTAFMLLFSQLIPLPWNLWAELPSSKLVADDLAFWGRQGMAMPMALSPGGVRESMADLIIPTAAFVAVLVTGPAVFRPLFATIIAVALLEVIISLAQQFYGAAGVFSVYAHPGALGLFNNRNFLATLICIAIPAIAAFTSTELRKAGARPLIVYGTAAVYGVFLVFGLGITGSRAGTILAMLAVLLSLIILFRQQGKGPRRLTASKKVIFIAVALLVVVEGAIIGLLRFVDTQPFDDLRSYFFATTLSLIPQYFPMGIGFGSFVQVYEKFEQPNLMMDRFVNHAHNDWLEIILEGGLPTLVIVLAASGLIAYAVYKAFRLNGQGAYAIHVQAAAISILIFTLHSAVDYPLRTPSLAAAFGAMAAILLSYGAVQQFSPRLPNKWVRQ